MIEPGAAVRVRVLSDWIPATVVERTETGASWRVRLDRPMELLGVWTSTLVRADRDIVEGDPPEVISAQSAPHRWMRRRGWRWWICRHCYAPKSMHPRMTWVKSRPLDDNLYLSANAPHFKEGW